MLIHPQSLLSVIVAAALAVACSQSPGKSGSAKAVPDRPHAVVAPSQEVPVSTKGKPRRPLQDWARYWLTE
jgi:hypothetical protein